MMKPDLSGLRFQVADTPELLAEAFRVRQRGYRRIFATVSESVDSLDSYSTVLVGVDDAQGAVLGCLRMTNRASGPLEAERYVRIPECDEPGRRAAELARLSVPHTARSPMVKLGLWKLAFLLAREQEMTHFIVSAKRSAKREYEFIGFEPSPRPAYSHVLLGNIPHYVLLLDLRTAPDRYRESCHPLYSFFCLERHAEIVTVNGGVFR